MEQKSDKTVITGLSWGGFLTSLVCVIDNRFKAAIPIYGCGLNSGVGWHLGNEWGPGANSYDVAAPNIWRDLVVTVKDKETNYPKPMALAMRNRLDDVGYKLGAVEVLN